MEWLKKRVLSKGLQADMLKKQHIVVVPSNANWSLANNLLYEILTADGRRTVRLTPDTTKSELRGALKAIKKSPSWLLVHRDTDFITDIAQAGVHPTAAAVSEQAGKEQALPIIRGLHPQRVMLCADGEQFETQARLIQKGTTMVTVGRGRAKFQIKELKTADNSTSFILISPLCRQEVLVPTTSEVVVCEIAMAIALAYELGCDSKAVASGIKHAW